MIVDTCHVCFCVAITCSCVYDVCVWMGWWGALACVDGCASVYVHTCVSMLVGGWVFTWFPVFLCVHLYALVCACGLKRIYDAMAVVCGWRYVIVSCNVHIFLRIYGNDCS